MPEPHPPSAPDDTSRRTNCGPSPPCTPRRRPCPRTPQRLPWAARDDEAVAESSSGHTRAPNPPQDLCDRFLRCRSRPWLRCTPRRRPCPHMPQRLPWAARDDAERVAHLPLHCPRISLPSGAPPPAPAPADKRERTRQSATPTQHTIFLAAWTTSSVEFVSKDSRAGWGVSAIVTFVGQALGGLDGSLLRRANERRRGIGEAHACQGGPGGGPE
jgi:hypothetical protein